VWKVPVPLDALQAGHADAELWWDSLPSAFEPWKTRVLELAPEERRGVLSRQLDAFFDPSAPARGLVKGVTTNPRLVYEGIMLDPARWHGVVQGLRHDDPGADEQQLHWRLYQEVFRRDATLLRPLWEESRGRHGWVCAQTLPTASHDGETLVRQGVELAAIHPNVMAKVVGSRAGYEAIEELTARGISTNNTLSFTVPQIARCIEALRRGAARARTAGVDLSRWRAVITYMIGRLGAEEEFLWQARERGIPLTPREIRWAEIAIYRRMYALAEPEAPRVKLLICSLKIDRDGDARSCLHLAKSRGSGCVYTLPPAFLQDLLDGDGDVSLEDADDVPAEVLEKLLRIPYFRQAYEPDGMTADEFGFHPAFLNGLREVNQGYRKTLDFIRPRTAGTNT
jgi:transaldolase